MYHVYGIKNCNTVKKTLDWLDSNSVSYEFIDYKKTPPTKTLLTDWKKQLGHLPVNTKGPTFRKIKEAFDSANLAGQKDLLLENTSAIKRPLITNSNGQVLTLGFNEEELEKNIR